ncbi:Cox family DNA-binding protein [Candidatus Williamhamiltonella defendens]|uniref:Cox family DNA-binding protein n=1 Tax=Candidatus Williamhamiltonella defendens TaxID=138072 RepID=UPI000C1F88DA|nr:Cox family DNA-binding protein [Candidatus Hamiltonella defensa]
MIKNDYEVKYPLEAAATRVGERWVVIPELNRIVREAYFNRPAEERDAWLKWLGL